MRKILIAFLFIAATLFVWVYFFIPTQLNINENILIKANRNSVDRAFNNMSMWEKSWPNADTANALIYNNVNYKPQLPGLYAYVIDVTEDGSGYKTILSIIERNSDSVVLSWKGTLSTGNNPFTRLGRYNNAKKIAGNMKNILQAAEKFMNNHQNIYGMQITNEIVKDTLLLNTQTLLTHSPSTEDIYTLVNKLSKAANDAGAPITGYPMMNITRSQNADYLLRVALPVSKPVKEENGIVIKRMFPGNILVSTDIKGGNNAVENAFRQMMNYVHDYNKTMPAIPFQSLITNRQLEKDSTKWITRIYCPVI